MNSCVQVYCRNFSDLWPTPHGTSQIILFTSTSASHTFTWFSENGQLPIARPWTHTPTPSWKH